MASEGTVLFIKHWMRLSFLILSCLWSFSEAHHRRYYKAAVFEHARQGTWDNPRHMVATNLYYYKRAVEIARTEDADIILFGEYGLFAPGNRSQLKEVLEDIPDPTSGVINPCNDTQSYLQRPILLALSCLARNNAMVVVANMGDIKECDADDKECPSDGVYHLNTNVVFQRDGTLLVRYYKERLFYEEGMDLPKQQQNSTFETDFGVFATYICFDIDFGRMSEVARTWNNLDGIMFSNMFVDQPPQMTSDQYWQSWALGNKMNLFSANLQIPGYLAVGSGIFHGTRGALAYTFNPDGISKMVVGRVAKRGFQFEPTESKTIGVSETSRWYIVDDGKDVPTVCSWKLLNASVDIFKDYRCISENYTDYTFVQLKEDNGKMEACNNGLCCSLEYKSEGLQDRFFLGVFNGTYVHYSRYSWHEEDCVLARCDALGKDPCSTFPTRAETKFSFVRLKGNFSSEVVYPSVVESGMVLTPLSLWRHEIQKGVEASINFRSDPFSNVIVVGMKGRRYDLDPPYIR